MEPQHEERRLTTILAADVVGYSRLMAADESGTLDQLKTHRRELIEPKTAEHHGRVVKLIGDGTLMEFGSVVDGVNFAVDVQKAMAERNADVPDNCQITYRIGINIGDIIVDGDDIYGDGVNVAARLEQLADPGGICVSRNVFNQVKNKLEIAFRDMGDQELKNIPEAVRAYKIIMPNEDAATVAAGAHKPHASPDKPSIAVLPFANMSGDPEQEFFADGMAEDIITALSHHRWFFVIARNSSFTYKGQAVDVKRVSQELGVRYVLEGSVRKSGNRVRVTAQLIDALSGHHIWAERYDRELEDIFAVQDEIAERIITSVAPGIVTAEMQRAHRKDVASLDAWDRVMRAHWHFARFTMEDSAKARRLLAEAAQIEPNSALALGDLAMIYVLDGQWGWGIARDQALAAAAEAARRAVAIDESNAWAHIALGMVELFARRHNEAIRRLERAIEISPNDPNAHGNLGFILSFAGEPEAASAQIEEARRLSPRDPFLAFWYTAQALAAFSAEHYEQAIEWSKKTIEENPSYPGAFRLLAASYGQIGDIERAETAVEEMLRLMPGITVTATREQVPWKKTDDAERYLEGLRKAGLPE